VVLTEAVVTRATSEGSDPDGLLVVDGVEFIHTNTKYLVKCKKEVILSAGSVSSWNNFILLRLTHVTIWSAIKDPQILELSGIGRREVLEKIGVEVRIDLPGVGENVQEHTMNFSTFELKNGEWGATSDDRKDPVKSAAALKL
jgi:choline dehydrogenase-like flavoprotein